MTRLVLIDGNAILHRAYHALPPLTSPDGSIVNAVYGFTSILIRLIHDLAPSHIAVAFDRAAPTFRKELYKEYQAKRPKMDDDLIPQINKVHDVLKAFNIPIFEKDGFEADDVIGTITKKNNVDQIVVVTGDRDILQLVEDEKVLVYMPTKGLSEGKLYGEKETEERLGVPPKLIPDYKALAGDASDNYPGIAGIGPKTAVEILKKAGSIDLLYKSIHKKSFGLSETIVKKIKESEEIALLSHKLATINREVPIKPDIPPFKQEQLTAVPAVQALDAFGFKSLIKRVQGSVEAGNIKTKRVRDNEIKKKPEDQLGLF